MPFIALIVEFLRARPVPLAAAAIGAQAALWVLVPSLFYASPPGRLAELLAVGREWPLGSWLGPPLPAWLAETAFRAAGWFGVYLLAQLCVATALWLAFVLARTLFGATYAAAATLLTTGVLTLSVPTPAFGAEVLAMPLTAAALLAYWHGLTRRRRLPWLALGVAVGLLWLTAPWAPVLMLLLAAFTLAAPEGRAALRDIDPWAAAALALALPFPYLGWLYRSGLAALPFGLGGDLAVHLARWPLLLAAAAGAHAGLALLVAAASGWGGDRAGPAPQLDRPPLPPLARRFAVVFAVAPIALGTLAAALLALPPAAAWNGATMLMSGAAVMAVAPAPLRVFRQRLLGPLWLAVLFVPPLAVTTALLVLPWVSTTELRTQEPADAMAQFFTESFHRRVGKPLAIVVGDTRPAYLVAAASPDRPSLASAERPERTPWIDAADLARRGGIVVWPMRGTSAQPPAAIRARFPGLVAEVPQSFPRPIQGLLPTYRVGWGVLRPATP